MGSGFRMLIKWFLGLLGMEHLFIYIYIILLLYTTEISNYKV